MDGFDSVQSSTSRQLIFRQNIVRIENIETICWV